MKAVIWIIVIVVIILLGWWIYSFYSMPAAPAPASTGGYNSSTVSVNQTPVQTVLATSTSATLGNYLTAPNGMTLYQYTKDTQGSGSSTCYSSCATQWPPYVVSSSAIVSGTLTGSTGNIGTITRTDGTLQVTYNGWPLYFYAKDSAAGQTTGQGVGGTWYVVAP